jgi:hypothetical protein
VSDLVYNTDIPKNTMTNYAEAFPGSTICPSNSNIAENLAAQGDQVIMDNTVKSFILERGYPVLYYPYIFEVDKAEHLFGEHSNAAYGVPFKTYVYMTIEDQPSWFAAQGIDTDETATIWIHIKLWKDTISEYLKDPECPQYHDYNKIYNLNYINENDVVRAIEPKVKDLIQLTTFGADREFDRGNKIFEITSKEDELFSEKDMNIAMGHYVWKVTAKRYRYSHEFGMSNKDRQNVNNEYIGEAGEQGNHIVSETKSVYHMFLEEHNIMTEDNKNNIVSEDNTVVDLLNGIYTTKVERTKVYKHDNTEDSKKNFDMDTRIKNVYKDPGNSILSNDLF